MYITLRESSGSFHKNCYTRHKLYIYFTRSYFASGLKTDFQPASIQRPTLHLHPWVTDLSTRLPRIPRHVKVSKYHTLIDSESYFLPPCSLRVSVLRVTNWGGVGTESQEVLCGRPCPSFSGTRSQGKTPRSPWHSRSAWCSSEHSLGIGVIFWRDPGISIWQKSRNILERKSDLCVNEEYSWKETLVTKLKSGDRGGAKLSHQFPLHPNNWRHFDHDDCSGGCFVVGFFKYFLV